MTTDAQLAQQALTAYHATTVTRAQFLANVKAGRYNPKDGSKTQWGIGDALLAQIEGVTPPPPPPPPAAGPWLSLVANAAVDPTLNAAALAASLPVYMSAGNAVVQSTTADVANQIGGNFDPTVYVPNVSGKPADDDGHIAVVNANGRIADFYKGVISNGKVGFSGGGSLASTDPYETVAGNTNAACLRIDQYLLLPTDLLAGATPHMLGLSLPPGILGGTPRYPANPAVTPYEGGGSYPMGCWFGWVAPPNLGCYVPDLLNATVLEFGHVCGFVVRDGGSPINVTGLDAVFQNGNPKDWGAVTNTSGWSTVNGYPYACQLTIPQAVWAQLKVLQPPPR